jgi:hypothetical protein
MVYTNTEKRRQTRTAYYHNNIEEQRELKRKERSKYRDLHRDELNEQHDCECGGSYIHKNKASHIRTQKHQSYLLTQTRE